jgi:hypothetical protein
MHDDLVIPTVRIIMTKKINIVSAIVLVTALVAPAGAFAKDVGHVMAHGYTPPPAHVPAQAPTVRVTPTDEVWGACGHLNAVYSCPGS